MTKSTQRTTEQQIADIAAGSTVLTTRNQSCPKKFNPSSVTHTNDNDNNNNLKKKKKKKNSQLAKKVTINLAKSSSPVIHDESEDCLSYSDLIFNRVSVS